MKAYYTSAEIEAMSPDELKELAKREFAPKMEMISIKMSKHDKNSHAAMAKKLGLTMSQYVRLGLNEVRLSAQGKRKDGLFLFKGIKQERNSK